MNMYLDILCNPIEYQGHGSKVNVTWVLCVPCLHVITSWTSWPAFTKSHNVIR